MGSKAWAQYAQYIGAASGISKPWLAIQWRLRLQDWRAIPTSKIYLAKQAQGHQALLSLGNGWQGQDATGLATGNPPGESR